MQPKIPIPKQELIQFCQQHQIRELALFGSVLREDFRPDSDVDVLIEFEPQAKIGLITLVGMQQQLTTLFRRPVDLVLRSGLKPLLKDEVLHSAQVIYAA